MNPKTQLSPKPHLVGIVNITEDSFSDGGRYLQADKAIEQAITLRKSGADSVDLGPAASSPEAKAVTPAEEMHRIGPVMEALTEKNIPFSVDSFHPDTQQFALERGAAYLNDIQSFPHPEMYSVLAQSECKLVMMHSIQRLGIATRQFTQGNTILETIVKFFSERISVLQKAGIERDRLILDPGMGFFLGNTDEPSLTVLKNLQHLKETFLLPLYICVSRKSFLNRLGGCSPQDCGAPTLAAELFATSQGIDFIRTHDVKALQQALRVWQQLG